MSKKFDPIKLRYDIKRYITECRKTSSFYRKSNFSIKVDRDANLNKFIKCSVGGHVDWTKSLAAKISLKLGSNGIKMAERDLDNEKNTLEILIPYDQKLKYLVFAPPEFNLNPIVYALY